MRSAITFLFVLGTITFPESAWAQGPTPATEPPENGAVTAPQSLPAPSSAYDSRTVAPRKAPNALQGPISPYLRVDENPPPTRPAPTSVDVVGPDSAAKVMMVFQNPAGAAVGANNKQSIFNGMAPCGENCGADCKTCCAKCFVFGDLLVWRTHGADVPFAQPFDGVGPLAAPLGAVASANFGFQTGFRLGAGVALHDHGWLVGTFTYFCNTVDASAAAPDGAVLHGNVVFPNTVNAAFLPLSADAHYVVRLFVGDLDYKCAIVSNDHLQLNWLAGARYAHIDQNFLANYVVFGTTSVNSGVNFDGIGPRAGMDGAWNLGCGFYGFSKGMLNLLAGRFNGSYLQQATFAGQQAQSHISDGRLVPVLEAELGVGWTSPSGCLNLMAGYYVGSWFNTMTIPTMIQGVQNNNYTTNGNNFRDTLSFDGLFGRVELRF